MKIDLLIEGAQIKAALSGLRSGYFDHRLKEDENGEVKIKEDKRENNGTACNCRGSVLNLMSYILPIKKHDINYQVLM